MPTTTPTNDPTGTPGRIMSRAAVANAARTVVKVGSSSLTSHGQLDPARLDAIVDAVAERVRSGKQAVLVSSGAIASIAVRIANEMDEGNVVFIVCDDGWKYLSSGLYTKPVEELEAMESTLWW